MVIMNSVLHFVLVFLSWISYFSQDFKGVELLLKRHCNLSWQAHGVTPTRHFKLKLVKAITESSGEEICRARGKKTYIRKYEKYYKQIIFLKKSLLRCTCAASVQPCFFPPILSPEYLGQYKCGKWQMGHHDDHAFLRSCPSTLLRLLSCSLQKHAVLLKWPLSEWMKTIL